MLTMCGVEERIHCFVDCRCGIGERNQFYVSVDRIHLKMERVRVREDYKAREASVFLFHFVDYLGDRGNHSLK